ncbi:helix-turn-helix transcriptional regulator [Frankia sp. AiPs1]|uniref:helix-turn-helix domain-containing protein n=1 Tax=Frankia sp. AiPs1 TaxID=573493 RepID=UPI0020439CCA|nr:helix-turn-helix transcriptional regulator [Frankia sp. AiPs1]MCM3924019.1 helix-turn-helix transcriptional regulator [Frankia sp. AiPs1]
MYRERPTTRLPATLWSARGPSGPAGDLDRADASPLRRLSTGDPAPDKRAAQVHRILPDGCIDIIWSSDGRLIVAGPDTVATLASWAPGVRHVGLRFDPGRGPARLGVPAAELRDRRPELADLWGGGPARRLAERLAEADDPALVLETCVAARPRHPELGDPLVAAIVAGIRAGSPVADVARAAALSQRQLLRRCRQLFGYGPKTLARILRLQEALRSARTGQRLAVVAADAGYADQAHLAREVRALTGVALTSLLAPARPSGPAPAGPAEPPGAPRLPGPELPGLPGEDRPAGIPGQGVATAGSGANRSTWLPSGSRTVA